MYQSRKSNVASTDPSNHHERGHSTILRERMCIPSDDEVWLIMDRLLDMQPNLKKPNFPFGLNIPSADVFVLGCEHGRLMNGGLEYFFAHDPVGGLDYRGIADIYQRIGAQHTARSIIDAAEAFPFSEPHLKCDDRCAFMYQESQKLEDLHKKTGEYRMLYEGFDRRIFDDETDTKILAYMKENLKFLPLNR